MQAANHEKVAAAVAIVRDAIAKVAALTDALDREHSGTSLRAVADRLYSERRKRDVHFPGLFGEPGWDLLLGLFIAWEDGREVTWDEACTLARIGPREAPALLARLEDERLVRCTSTGGRDLVALTEHGAERLTDYLADLI